MIKLKLITISIMLFFMQNLVYAQDIILTRDNKIIKCKVIEITENNIIKYLNYNTTSPIRNIYTNKVKKIQYEDNTVEEFEKQGRNMILSDAPEDWSPKQRIINKYKTGQTNWDNHIQEYLFFSHGSSPEAVEKQILRDKAEWIRKGKY